MRLKKKIEICSIRTVFFMFFVNYYMNIFICSIPSFKKYKVIREMHILNVYLFIYYITDLYSQKCIK